MNWIDLAPNRDGLIKKNAVRRRATDCTEAVNRF